MDTSLSYIIKKEKEERGLEVLAEHWIHGYMDRSQIEFSLGWKADRVNYWQRRLEARGLLKVWKRPSARHQLETSLTSKGERYLEGLGYENRAYAQSLRQSDNHQRVHRLQVTRSSLAFERGVEVLEWQAEVRPGMRFPIQGKTKECDKVWLLPGQSFIVECENSPKGFDELEEIFQLYAQGAKDDVFAQMGLHGARVLYIVPTPGRIPKLLKAAKRAQFDMLFYFTDETKFSDDCRNLLTGYIWRICDREEMVSL